jgi:Fe-S-cluster containining protein
MPLSFLRKLIPGRREGIPSLGAIQVPREAAERAAPRLLALHEALRALADEPGLDGFREDRRLPPSFPDRMDAILAAYDTFAAGLVEDVPLATTCARGCAHCCHDAPTPVRGFELLNLYRVARQDKGFRRRHDRAVERAEQFLAELERHAGGKRSLRSDSEPFLAARMAYARAYPACPFLHPKRLVCEVYDVRPLPCRMHVSLDEPARCDPRREGDEPRTPNLAPPEPLVETMRTIDARLGLSVSAVLPVGFAELGAQVMRGEPVTWREA